MQTSQTPTVLTVERRAPKVLLFTHRPESYHPVKNKGVSQIKGLDGQLRRSLRDKARVKSVFPRDSLAQVQAKATSTMVKAHIYVGFCTKTLTKEAQTSHQWNDTLAILRCPQLDQTATNEAQMIEEMIGQD
ncbi:hypothetical protein Tco_1234782 [Tanacetum coccineum]